MALIPKRASASGHRCHNDPAILRYALKGTSKPRHVPSFLLVVTRTAGLTFRPHCRTYGGARTNALAIGNDVCIGGVGCCLGTDRAMEAWYDPSIA